MAEEKFNGAKLLMGQGLHSSALELLLSAQLATAAERAGIDIPKTAAEAGVWVYGEAIPKGILSREEAGLIMQAVGLAQAPTVPEVLMDQLIKDTREFMAG
jgi:fructose-specific component phosphotransferase system IIB-like protein